MSILTDTLNNLSWYAGILMSFVVFVVLTVTMPIKISHIVGTNRYYTSLEVINR